MPAPRSSSSCVSRRPRSGPGTTSPRPLLLEPQEPPGQLHQATSDPCIAGLGQTPFAAFGAALIGRSRDAGIAGHGSAVPQVSRQDLLHQHVRRLDAHADDARQEPHHRVPATRPEHAPGDPPELARSSRSACAPTPAGPCRVASRPACWAGSAPPPAYAALRGAPAPCSSSGLKPRMPSRISAAFMRLMILVRSPTRFSRSRLGRLASSSSRVGNRHHLAMSRLPAQPSQEHTDEHLGVEPIRLGSPVLTRHRNARRMHDVSFDAASPQPPRQPEPVPTSLESEDHPRHRPVRLSSPDPANVSTSCSSAAGSGLTSSSGRRSTPGTTPAASQLDWLISRTATNVPSAQTSPTIG